MIRLSTARGIRIEAVIYPITEQQMESPKPHGLEKLVSTTHGSTFSVMDEGFGNVFKPGNSLQERKPSRESLKACTAKLAV